MVRPMTSAQSPNTGAPRSFDDLLAFDEFVLFGAGGGTHEVESVLGDAGKRVIGYCDNSPAKQGQKFNGKPVFRPGELKTMMGPKRAIVISAAYQSEIAAQLTGDLGVERARVFPFVSPMFRNHFGRRAVEPHLAAFEDLMGRLEDQESRDYLSALMRFRWTMDPADLRRNPLLAGFYHYKAAGLGPRKGDHIVDVGAYTGDTAQMYLERLSGDAHVSALEPLPRNLEAMARTIEENGLKDKVSIYPFAAGDAPGTAEIISGAPVSDPRATLRSADAPSRETIRVETLDRLFLSGKRRVNFIKIDVEGFEPAVLAGGAQLIARDRPDLALALYHTPEQLFTLPAQLDRIAPGYRFYLGHHPSAPYECELFASAD